MTQKGPHTWDLILDYHRCLRCGYIIESRNSFLPEEHGVWAKTILCERCGNQFVVKKTRKSFFGPLMGDPQPTEINWDL